MDTIFDTELLIARKRRARALGDTGAQFLMAHAAADLSLRLEPVTRRFEDAAVLFSLTQHAADAMRDGGKAQRILRVETDPGLLGEGDMLAAPETVPLTPGSLDLAVSLYGLHEMNDIPGVLVQIRRALRPDGLFLGCMAGAGTLGELREALLAAEAEVSGGAAPRIYPFAEVRDAGALLQRAGFALPVSDVETVKVRYDDMFALMRDLRAMGATSALSARSRRPTPRRLFLRAAEIYAERFSDPDGRVRATFSTIWMSGWVPHESQQKPLQPGSAKVSLAKILEGK